jgi:hypothetical protein
MSPTEQIKRDIIQLARDATDHYAKSYEKNEEKWAFAVKTRVLAIRLQNYTPIETRYWLRDIWKEEREKEDAIWKSDLNPDNKKINALNVKFRYALRVYDMCLSVLHNSPIVETKSDGIINVDLPELKDRVRTGGSGGYSSGVKTTAIRKEEIVVEQETDQEDDEI